MNIETDSQKNSDVNAAIFQNSYKQSVLWPNRFGFRTSPLRRRVLHAESSCADDFLANTGLRRHDPQATSSIEAYLEDPGVTMMSYSGREDFKDLRKLPLPDGVPIDLSLDAVMLRRRSVRQFTGDSIGLEALATLVRMGLGVTAQAELQLWGGGSTSVNFRAVPSAGGLYPIDLYFVAQNIVDLKSGLYRFDPLGDQLLEYGNEEVAKKIVDAISVPENQISYSRANVIFLLIARPWKTMRKYGDRGMRFVFHETGGIAQNLHLGITGLGLGGVDCASIYDGEVHQALGFDGVFQALTHALLAGVPG